MYKYLLWVSLAMAQTIAAYPQSSKKLQKVIKTYKSGKMDKAIRMMDKIVEDYPTSENWDITIKLYYERHQTALSLLNLISSQMPEVIETDEGEQISISIESPYLSELMAKCREAALHTKSIIASQFLRNQLVDYPTDTAISELGLEEYSKAENLFGQKHYESAISHYRKALESDTGYYKATLYLGDSHWLLKNPDSAAIYYQKGIAMHPTLLEPRKYLVDALTDKGKYPEAAQESIKALSLFPDEAMYLKYEHLAKKQDKKYDRHWLPRGCEVNQMNHESPQIETQPWVLYQSAKQDIYQYCDSDGVITMPNQHTDAKYLEVFAWEVMLNSSHDLPYEMTFAKKMMDEGYLDCYVFLSVFHIDTYSQFQHFAQNNKEKIKTYFEKYLTH